MSLPPAVECFEVGVRRLRRPDALGHRTFGLALLLAGLLARLTDAAHHHPPHRRCPDFFASSIRVSIRLTTFFCSSRVVSPVSGLESFCSMSRISLMISPAGPLRSPSSPFFRRFRPVSSSRCSSVSLSLPERRRAIGLTGLLRRPAGVGLLARRRHRRAAIVLRGRLGRLAELLEQLVDLLILARERRRVAGLLLLRLVALLRRVLPAAWPRPLRGPSPCPCRPRFFAASACRPSLPGRRPTDRTASRARSRARHPSGGESPGRTPDRRQADATPEADRDGHDRDKLERMRSSVIPPHRPVSVGSCRGRGRPACPDPRRAA